MYTTIKGNAVQLTPKVWRRIKRCANGRFEGSQELFESCWRKYRQFVNGATDDPENLGDVMGWLDTIAAEKVNDSESRFYIHG